MQPLDHFLQDMRYASRSLRKRPGFAAAAILTLALGIGANTAIFSVVRAVLLDPLPYVQPEHLVTISATAPDRPDDPDLDYTLADYWRNDNRSFARLSGYRDGLGVLVLDGKAEMLRGLRVSYDFFDTLGVKMELGRTFRREEDQPNQRTAIILSHDFWVRRFGADPYIIGRVLQLDNFRLVVVGVLPQGFEPLLKATSELTPEMYVPLSLGPGVTCCRAVRVVARLKPNVTMVQARGEMTTLTRNFAQQSGAVNWRQAAASVVPLPQRLLGRFAAPLWAAWMAAVFILLMACANVANLVLARGASRTKEMAARAAVGASRGRLAAQLVAENLLLALAGSFTGILLAFAGTPMLVSLAPPQMLRVQHARMDAWVLAFGLAAGVFTSLLFGLAPVLRLSRVDLNQALKAAGNTDGHRHRSRFHYRFAAAQLALAFVLVMGAILMLKSFVRLQRVDLGFDPHNVLTLTTQGPARLEEVLDRIRAIPGVESAAVTSTIPMDQVDRRPLLIAGRAVQDPAQAPLAEVATVSPDYFRVMRIPLKRGRLFNDHDSPQAPRVVLISESCAHAQFAGEDPIGKDIMLGEIVGVVGDVRLDRVDLAPAMQVYVSQTQHPNGIFRLAARTRGDPLRMEGVIRSAFLSVDKMQVVYHVKSLDEYVAGAIAERSFSFGLQSLFGALALILGATGIYGVISYAASRRTREIGIRMALGAEYRDVLASVLRHALRPIAAGLAAGLAASPALTRLLANLLFEVRPADLATMAEVALLLALVAIAAAYLPARRAARIDPVAALRQD